MATRDSLKYFSDFDGYSGSLTKADMDNNLKTLADAVDEAGYFSEDANGVIVPKSDGKSFSTMLGGITTGVGMFFDIYKQAFRAGNITENIISMGIYSTAFGYSNTASGIYSTVFGGTNTASGVCSTAFGGTNTASGTYSTAFGYSNTASGDYSTVFGYSNTASADYSTVFGVGTTNKQNFSLALGVTDINHNFNINKNAFAIALYTTDDTQTNDSYMKIMLSLNSYTLIKLEGNIIRDDLSERWIFERVLRVKTASDGTITIETDDNTDIIKDVVAWDVTLEPINDSANPYIDIKVTGEASKNIYWGIIGEKIETAKL